MNLAKKLKKIFFRQIEKRYVSPIDKFLAEFDKKHPKKSMSQLKEIEKYKRIAYLRDHAERSEKDSKIWEGF